MRRLSLIAVAALCLAACGSPSPQEDAISHHEATIEAPAASGSADEANWQRFADNVQVWTHGYKLTMRLGREAGTPEQRLADLHAGKAQVAALEPKAAAALVPELSVLSAPQLFDSQAEADFVLDDTALQQFQPLFVNKGLRLLGWYDDDWADPATRDSYQAGVVVADNAWFERLPPKERDIFRQAYGSAGEARKASRAARRQGQSPVDATAGPARPAAEDDVAALQQQAVAKAGGQASQIYDAIRQAKLRFMAQEESPAAPVTTLPNP